MVTVVNLGKKKILDCYGIFVEDHDGKVQFVCCHASNTAIVGPFDREAPFDVDEETPHSEGWLYVILRDGWRSVDWMQVSMDVSKSECQICGKTSRYDLLDHEGNLIMSACFDCCTKERDRG